jgi:DNA-binding GntR family transcriptional regulator
MAPGLNVQGGIATLADAAAAELRERILDGELESGQPLRLEELARQLGMSISPIREAVRKLEALGLAEHVAHRGSRVTHLGVEDVRDTYEARYALEPLAIARAAARITPEEIAAARAALARYMACFERGDLAGGREAHDAFHFALYQASGSSWLVRLIRPTWENSERYRGLAMPDLETIRAREHEHAAILEATAAHDGERAAAALREHLAITEQFVVERLTAPR